MATELEDDFLSYRKCQLADIVGVGYLLLIGHSLAVICYFLLFFKIFYILSILL